MGATSPTRAKTVLERAAEIELKITVKLKDIHGLVDWWTSLSVEKALRHLMNFTLQVYGLHLSYRVDQRNAGNGPQVNAAGQNAVQAQPAAGNAAGGGGAALGFQPYIRPRMFAFKVNTSPSSLSHPTPSTQLLYICFFKYLIIVQNTGLIIKERCFTIVMTSGERKKTLSLVSVCTPARQSILFP